MVGARFHCSRSVRTFIEEVIPLLKTIQIDEELVQQKSHSLTDELVDALKGTKPGTTTGILIDDGQSSTLERIRTNLPYATKRLGWREVDGKRYFSNKYMIDGKMYLGVTRFSEDDSEDALPTISK